MQVSRDSGSLVDAYFQSHIELSAESLKTQLIKSPRQCEKCSHARDTEPICLEPCGYNGERQRCPSLVPDSVVVACDHPKAIRSRWEVSVEGLTPRSRVLPFLVSAFELVAELYFLWIDETQSSVIDLQVARQRAKRQSVGRLVRFSVCDKFLDLDGGHDIIVGEVTRIDHLQGVSARDPEAAIRRPRHRVEISWRARRYAVRGI